VLVRERPALLGHVGFDAGRQFLALLLRQHPFHRVERFVVELPELLFRRLGFFGVLLANFEDALLLVVAEAELRCPGRQPLFPRRLVRGCPG